MQPQGQCRETIHDDFLPCSRHCASDKVQTSIIRNKELSFVFLHKAELSRPGGGLICRPTVERPVYVGCTVYNKEGRWLG
jgi:hypothetical protein